MPATIAFVGLGAMGAEMAETLVSKQWRVVGYDIRREAIDRLVKNGGHAAASAAEAAKGAEALVLMVVNADQAEMILFKDGALEALPAGGTVVLMATCAPARVEDIAKRVEASGRKFVDAPVSGGVTGAKGGTLTIMAAAPQATFDAARPMLSRPEAGAGFRDEDRQSAHGGRQSRSRGGGDRVCRARRRRYESCL